MKSLNAKALYAVLAGLCLAGTASAANIPIGDGSARFLISTSQTWTANNVYNLRGQVYVAPGATLTIEAGTVIKSNPTDLGSLAICRGAKIIANGTPTKPIIFTSTNDDLVTKRNAATEWGNITIMGRALVGASYKNTSPGNVQRAYDEGTTNTSPFGTVTTYLNTGSPTGVNKCPMEGLVAELTGDPRVLYGGDDDNDDSGSLSYVSLRFGGRVIAATDELNGLSLGAVGRNTDIHHIDIWDNVDDGIEAWGGTVNLKYISIWNIGDDTLDLDQGYRGKVQFGLLVQGYSVSAAMGSGVGDNCIEIDGAERNDAQPVTTTSMYNLTVIGMPQYLNLSGNGGDKGIALRDEARVQIRNSIFMNIGENLLVEEASETPGASGNDTTSWRYRDTGPVNAWNSSVLSWNEVWTTSYDAAWNKAHALNALTSNHANVSTYSQSFLQSLYAAQTTGNLCEISDCVFYGNANASFLSNAVSGYTAVSALPGANNHDNVTNAANSPIVSITRDPHIATTGGEQQLVATLNPRAANDAVTSVGAAPADGFFSPVNYRGAFSKDVNWALGWTAASAFGIMTDPDTATTPPASGASLVTVVSFPTFTGVIYTIESSTDGKNWSPVKTIVGDGSTKTLSAEITVDSARVYRAVAQ